MPTKQTTKILRHIRQHGSITPLEALQEYGIMRLASRMCDIKRAGFEVHKEMETSNNRYGEAVRYARYTIPELRKDMRA